MTTVEKLRSDAIVRGTVLQPAKNQHGQRQAKREQEPERDGKRSW